MEENVDVINSKKIKVDKTSIIKIEVKIVFEKKISTTQYKKLNRVIM